jgi:hypothetical protein
MAANCFSLLPYDTKMKIATYLQNTLSFNAVLCRDENVYKKLPLDYAIKHHINMTHMAHTNLCTRIIHHMNKMGSNVYKAARHAHAVEKYLFKLFDLWLKPTSATAIMYQKDLKQRVISTLESWSEENEENDIYNNLIDGGLGIREKANSVLSVVKKIVYIHHVSIREFTSVFD